MGQQQSHWPVTQVSPWASQEPSRECLATLLLGHPVAPSLKTVARPENCSGSEVCAARLRFVFRKGRVTTARSLQWTREGSGVVPAHALPSHLPSDCSLGKYTEGLAYQRHSTGLPGRSSPCTPRSGRPSPSPLCSPRSPPARGPTSTHYTQRTGGEIRVWTRASVTRA